jgi:hypothetical protein
VTVAFRWIAGVLVLVPTLAAAQTLSGAADWTVASGTNASGSQASANHSFWQHYAINFGSFVLDPRLLKYDAGLSLGTNQLSFRNDQGAQQGGQRAVGYKVSTSIFPARPFPLSVQISRDTRADSGVLPTSSIIRGGIVVPAGEAVPDFQTLNHSLSVNWQLKVEGLPHVDLGYRSGGALVSGGGYAAEQRDGDLHLIVSKDTPGTHQALSFQKTSFENFTARTFNQRFNELGYDVGVPIGRRSRFTARAGRRSAFSLLDAPPQMVDSGSGIALPLVQGRTDTAYAMSGVTFEPSRRVSLGLSGSLDNQQAATISTASRLLTTTARFEPLTGLSLSASGDYGTRAQVLADVPLTVLTRMAQAGANYRAGVRWLQGTVAVTRRIGENSAIDGRIGHVQAWSADTSLSVSAGRVSATGGYGRQRSEDAILDFGNFDIRRRRASVQVTGQRVSVTGSWDRSTSDRGLALMFGHAVQDTYLASLGVRRRDSVIAASVGGFDSRTILGRDRTWFAGATVESRLRKVQLSAALREEVTAASAAGLDQWNLVGFVKAEYTRRQFGFGVEYRRSAQQLRFAQMMAPTAFRGRQFLLRITRRFGVRL